MNDFVHLSAPPELSPGRGYSKERLMKIAKSQRVVLFFILMYFPLIFMLFALIFSKWPEGMAYTILFFAFAYTIFSVIHIFLLAKRTIGLGMAIISAFMNWIFPPIGFILLLIINGKASSILKGEGYKVGLLGVNPKAFKK